MNVKLLNDRAKLPVYGSDQAAGLDLCTTESVVIPPYHRALLRTGIAVELPVGTVGLIWPRSKLAAKYGLDTLAGVVDADFRGELMISVINHGKKSVELHRGDKVAQMLVQPVIRVNPVEVDHLDSTERGSKGINCTDMRMK